MPSAATPAGQVPEHADAGPRLHLHVAPGQQADRKHVTDGHEGEGRYATEA